MYLVVACDEQNGIGKGGKLPWRLKKEMQYFKTLTSQTKDPTKQNMVLMGRKTWESIPDKFRPLPERVNVVLTNQKGYSALGAFTTGDFDEALNIAKEVGVETIFVIGGAQIYSQALELSKLNGVYITRVHEIYECDTFLKELPNRFTEVLRLGGEEEDGIKFEYMLYTTKN